MKLPYVFRDSRSYKPAKYLGRVLVEVNFKLGYIRTMHERCQELIVPVIRRTDRSLALQFVKAYRGGIEAVSIKANCSLLIEHWNEIVALAVVEEL